MRRISILIAAFDASRWIGDCVLAIQRQELPDGWDVEILVGIDACAATLQAVEGLSEPRLRAILLERNSGPYVTFNTLMLIAAGERICRFDSDDVMLPGYLRAQLASIDQGAELSMSWSIFTDENLEPTSRIIAQPYYHPSNGEHRAGSEGCFVMTRQVWNRLGGFRSWRCAADSDFRDRATARGIRLRVVEEFLYLRRTHHDSLTASEATNFDSPLRGRYRRQIERFKEDYARSRSSLWVAPRVAGFRICAGNGTSTDAPFSDREDAGDGNPYAGTGCGRP